jgi:type VI protein secretion system component VasF
MRKDAGMTESFEPEALSEAAHAPQAQEVEKPTEQQPVANAATGQQASRRARRLRRTFFRVVIWVVVLVVVLFLALIASAYLAGFESIWDMLAWARETYAR